MMSNDKAPLEQYLGVNLYKSHPSRIIEPFGIFHAPVLYCDEWRYWKPTVDPREEQHRFEFVNDMPEDAFKGRHLPMKNLNLRATEELIAVRAKKRPVIVIRVDHKSDYKDFRSRNGTKPMCIALPVYSLVDIDGRLKDNITPLFMEKMQYCFYAQFLHLPRGGPIRRDSMVRFDRILHIAVEHMEYTGYEIHEDFRLILMGCLTAYLNNGAFDSDYQLVQEIIETIQSDARDAIKVD